MRITAGGSTFCYCLCGHSFMNSCVVTGWHGGCRHGYRFLPVWSAMMQSAVAMKTFLGQIDSYLGARLAMMFCKAKLRRHHGDLRWQSRMIVPAELARHVLPGYLISKWKINKESPSCTGSLDAVNFNSSIGCVCHMPMPSTLTMG